MSRLTRTVVLALIALAVLAGPAATAAQAGVIDYGAVANCRYRVTAEYQGTWTKAVLKRIAVEPPTIAKTAGTKSVGWRFLVQRSLDRGNTPWVVTYRSPIQRASSSAGLTPMRVGVSVPAEDQSPNGRDHIYYQVILKMFWYRADGSVQNKVTHVMNDMNVFVADEQWTDSVCQGAHQQYVD